MQGGLRRFPSSPASCGVHVEALGRRICVREAGLSPSFSLPIPQYFTQPCVGMPLSYWAHPLLPLGFFPSAPAEEVKGLESNRGAIWSACGFCADRNPLNKATSLGWVTCPHPGRGQEEDLLSPSPVSREVTSILHRRAADDE